MLLAYKMLDFTKDILISIVIILGLGNAITGSYARTVTDCYANNMNPYLKFATKTAYEFVYERQRGRFDGVGVPDCEPVQIWLLARHGTRYPGRSDIRSLQQLQELRTQIIRNHEERRNGRLCYADLENLKTWDLNATMADAGLLTKQGWSDLYFLAKRFRTMYPSLFQQGYSQNLFEFRHTNTERTRQSAQAFAEGLFGPGSGIWIPPPVENDTIIKPYDNCTHWSRWVDNNPDTLREVELFKLSEDMNEVVHNVSARLGFLYDITLESVLAIYDMCRYDKSWFISQRSPWCAALVKEELLVLEYLYDLKSYYSAGYGHPLNKRLGCTTIKDMLQRFEALEDENLQKGFQPVGVFYFSHSAMLAMTLARLGIADRDLRLRHDNYREMRKREWRSSELTPLAGNLAAVFFKCTTGEYNRVMFYLNEKQIDYDGCEVGLCSWSYIRNKFHDVPQHCSLDWCRDSGASVSLTVYLLLAPIALLFLYFRY